MGSAFLTMIFMPLHRALCQRVGIYQSRAGITAWLIEAFTSKSILVPDFQNQKVESTTFRQSLVMPFDISATPGKSTTERCQNDIITGFELGFIFP